MNIKIKSSGVFCLIGDDYDKVFIALKKQFGESDEQMFTERTPGHEYLQWELPGDGWVALSASDPLMLQEVKRVLLCRQQNISRKFGSNQAMAQKVLSVPDDDYVYYKNDEAGHLLIRLTAWGYRYPERVGGGNVTTNLKSKEETEHISISLMYDGKPLSGKSLRLNGFLRTTDANGLLDVGDLPIGYQFDIEVDKQQQHVTVTPEEGEIKIDLTEYTTVEVQASLDNVPYSGGQVTLSYMGRNMQLTCDSSGRVTAKLPLDKEGSLCTVTIDNSTQQEPLRDSINVFVLQLTSPPKEEKEEKHDDPVDEKPDEEPADEVIDMPSGNEQQEPEDDVIEPQNTTVEIRVTLDDVPYSGVQVALSYMENQMQLECDDEGYVMIQLPLDAEESLCRVSVEDVTLQKPLTEGVNTFEFHLESEVIVPSTPPVDDKPEKAAWWMLLLEILAVLALIGLIYLAYSFCGSFLFG